MRTLTDCACAAFDVRSATCNQLILRNSVETNGILQKSLMTLTELSATLTSTLQIISASTRQLYHSFVICLLRYGVTGLSRTAATVKVAAAEQNRVMVWMCDVTGGLL